MPILICLPFNTVDTTLHHMIDRHLDRDAENIALWDESQIGASTVPKYIHQDMRNPHHRRALKDLLVAGLQDMRNHATVPIALPEVPLRKFEMAHHVQLNPRKTSQTVFNALLTYVLPDRGAMVSLPNIFNLSIDSIFNICHPNFRADVIKPAHERFRRINPR